MLRRSNGSRNCWRSVPALSWAACLVVAANDIDAGLPKWETVFEQHENRDYLGKRPRTRYSHTQTLVGEEIIVAFGYFYDHYDNGKATWEADVWSLSDSPSGAGQWRIITSGEGFDKPLPRMNHVAVTATTGRGKNQLVVFGGTDKDHTMLNDLWELDVKTGSWLDHAVPIASRPPPRNCFAAALLKGEMFIYGGFHLGDLWRYSFVDHRWKLMIDAPKLDSPEHPGKRAAHSAVTAPNGEDMYVYGGFRFPDDVSDAARFAHGKLTDMWVYRYAENRWELVPQAQTEGGREYFTMVVAPWRLRGIEHIGLITFGGVQCNPDCSLVNSLAFFSLNDHRWRHIDATEKSWPLYQHGMVMYRDALWIFGGESYTPHMYHNSVKRLSWPVPEVPDTEGLEL